MTKNIFNNDYLNIIKIPRNEDLKNILDDVLVSLAQEDIDFFRYSCVWKCETCGKAISYKDSLAALKEKYIHDLKCNDIQFANGNIKCKGLMMLNHKNNLDINSIYFNELLSRYQDRIIAEAMKCKKIEDPHDVYSIILGFFMKIVGKFAREESFSKTSDKWFSTYFWVSIRNKTTDIRKTNNYIKRSPFIYCEVCKNSVGQINSRHLLEKNHEELLDKVKYNIGINFVKESGEIKYYIKATKEELNERCLKIGDDFINFIDIDLKKDFLSRELYRTYCEEYPGSPLKNVVSSLNETIYEDDSEKIDHIFCDREDNNEVIDLINILISKAIEPSIKKINNYFEDNVDISRKMDIIKSILIDKSSYNGLSDKEIDLDYEGEAKKGLTAAIFKLIASNNKIKEEITKMQKINIY